MKTVIILIFLICSSLNSTEFKNELQYETSPYLLAHQNNPIKWMAWNKAAFKKAKEQNKAIFLSIGYSTCHWCHVMEKESFSNINLAELFNKYFICIKVDREEMSHIDAQYQNIFFKHHHRSAGWPLSIFMTPKKEVFFTAGYIPATKESYSQGFDTLLEELGEGYKTHSQNFLTQVQSYRENKNISSTTTTTQKALSKTTLTNSIKEQYDEIYSGFGNSRKFPEASKLSLLMDLAQLQKDKELQTYTYEMLDMMALRGLYDHIDGGFFRYTVDAAWETPHFEKMLYTQAELIPLYVRGYLQTGKKLYRDIVVETLAMVDKRFKKDNLYYSASDAQSAEEEGAYFTFSKEEIEKTSLEFTANFEEKMLINIYDDKRPSDFTLTQAKLKKVREKRKYPFIDKKINTAWNSLMIQALYSSASIDKKYGLQGDKTLKALSKLMFVRSSLYHQTLLGVKPKQKALLEDYSTLIAALISAYEYSYDETHLNFAEYLLTQALEKFYKRGVWYLSDDSMHIKAGLKDKYYISPLSLMVQNLLNMAALRDSFKYEKIAQETLDSLFTTLSIKQAITPALAKAYLMQKLKVVVLKSKKENLLKHRAEIEKIDYPYLLTKEKDFSNYLACSIRQCFAIDENLTKVAKTIEKECTLEVEKKIRRQYEVLTPL